LKTSLIVVLSKLNKIIKRIRWWAIQGKIWVFLSCKVVTSFNCFYSHFLLSLVSPQQIFSPCLNWSACSAFCLISRLSFFVLLSLSVLIKNVLGQFLTLMSPYNFHVRLYFLSSTCSTNSALQIMFLITTVFEELCFPDSAELKSTCRESKSVTFFSQYFEGTKDLPDIVGNLNSLKEIQTCSIISFLFCLSFFLIFFLTFFLFNVSFIQDILLFILVSLFSLLIYQSFSSPLCLYSLSIQTWAEKWMLFQSLRGERKRRIDN